MVKSIGLTTQNVLKSDLKKSIICSIWCRYDLTLGRNLSPLCVASLDLEKLSF